jgi:hypothetical protein
MRSASPPIYTQTAPPAQLNNPQPAVASAQRAVSNAPAASIVTLRYLATSPIAVQGPATGTQYEFSGARPVQHVDARDAAALLRTRFFRQA